MENGLFNFHNFGAIQSTYISIPICNHIVNNNFIFHFNHTTYDKIHKTFDLVFQKLQVHLQSCINFDRIWNMCLYGHMVLKKINSSYKDL
jgi:hypothetical protein